MTDLADRRVLHIPVALQLFLLHVLKQEQAKISVVIPIQHGLLKIAKINPEHEEPVFPISKN